jgi:hypothetical protein
MRPANDNDELNVSGLGQGDGDVGAERGGGRGRGRCWKRHVLAVHESIHMMMTPIDQAHP